MKVTVEFQLPEEREEHELFMAAPAYFRIVEGFAKFLRTKMKHESLKSIDYAIYEDVQKAFYELVMAEHVEV